MRKLLLIGTAALLTATSASARYRNDDDKEWHCKAPPGFEELAPDLVYKDEKGRPTVMIIVTKETKKANVRIGYKPGIYLVIEGRKAWLGDEKCEGGW